MRAVGGTGAWLRPLATLAAFAVLLAGCGYIVTPEDDASPTPATPSAGWTALATKVEAASGGLHVDVTLRNDSGDWSSMTADATGSVSLTGADGKSVACTNIAIGTGGNNVAPGLQVRGYTSGTKADPKTQLIGVDCPVAPAAGQRLAVAYTFTMGPFNYYSPARPAKGTLAVDLDKLATDLTYPIATEVTGLVQKADASIEAINQCVLTLTKVERTADGYTFSWHTQNPTDYPTYVHIGTPPVVGSDGVIYGLYKSPHLAITPITPAKSSTDWTTEVIVPKDVTTPYILLSVESQAQKFFVSHLVAIGGS
jgi:hypothetical protein